MILSIEEALLALRTEYSPENAQIILDLIAAIPSYIDTTTGINGSETAADKYPLIKTLAKFLLCVWYNPDGTDAVTLQVVVNNLLKTLKAMAPEINGE